MNEKNKNLKVKAESAIYASAFMNFSVALIFIFVSSKTLSSNSSPDDFCKKYDWEKVERLVEPYLDDESYTTLVMQGLSSDYNTSVAASQAIHSQLPQEIYNILVHIIRLNCS